MKPSRLAAVIVIGSALTIVATSGIIGSIQKLRAAPAAAGSLWEAAVSMWNALSLDTRLLLLAAIVTWVFASLDLWLWRVLKFLGIETPRFSLEGDGGPRIMPIGPGEFGMNFPFKCAGAECLKLELTLWHLDANTLQILYHLSNTIEHRFHTGDVGYWNHPLRLQPNQPPAILVLFMQGRSPLGVPSRQAMFFRWCGVQSGATDPNLYASPAAEKTAVLERHNTQKINGIPLSKFAD